MSKLSLQPLRRQDLKVGEPIQYPIYDGGHKLLLREGQVIHSEKQLDNLFTLGLFQNPNWHKPTSPAGGREKVDVTAAEGGGEAPAAYSAPVRQKNLAQLKLQPGNQLFLESPGDPSRPRFPVKLIGFQERGSIIVSALSPQGAVLPFREGDAFTAKTTAAQDVVVFQTSVSKICFVPYPYLHLSYPSQIQVMQLRKAQRVQTRLIASSSNQQQSTLNKIPVVIINLSAGGALLESKSLLGRVGEMLMLTFKVETLGQDYYLAISTVIRSRKPAEGDSPEQYGLQFNTLPIQDQLVLENYIFHALLEQ